MNGFLGRIQAAVLLLTMLCVTWMFTGRVSVASAASDEAPGPPIVLVLKLISKTHVKPVTGIVLTEDGLVLVPASFVSAGDEIVVLDGGADITRYGRPAKTVARSAEYGLAVLSVDGLQRIGIHLAREPAVELRDLHLAAFPPAEDIRKGTGQLWAPVSFSVDQPGDMPSVAADTPLPNVTGPVVDRCGRLVALNLAVGTQTREPSEQPTMLFAKSLAIKLVDMDVLVPYAFCNPRTGQSVVDETPTPEPAVQQGESTGTADGVGTTDLRDTDRSDPTADSGGADSAPNEPPQAGVAASGPTGFDSQEEATGPRPGRNEANDASTGATNRLKWLVTFLSVTLLAVGWVLARWMRRRREYGHAEHVPGRSNGMVDSNEPATELLEISPALGTGKAGSATTGSDFVHLPPRPDPANLPRGHDGILEVEGVLSDGTRFKRFCTVDRARLDVDFGRNRGAISIESASISRLHARLQGDENAMTLSDLESSNGTWIKGVPCLASEVMYFEPGDEIVLGDVLLRIKPLAGPRS